MLSGRFILVIIDNINDVQEGDVVGIYFNPDNGSFSKAIKSQIYIDKTGLLNELNKVIGTENNCIAVSHARRFGKSQAAGMIDAYYSRGSDSKELFSKFVIAKSANFEEHLNQYNVIHLDIASVSDFHKDDLVETIIKDLCDEFKDEYRGLDDSKDIQKILMEIYKISGIQFVILIDEWDCVIRNHSDRPDLVHKYLQFMHALFKSEESKRFLALGYITGILPIKKIRDESALNNFREFTMLKSRPITQYYGFTEEVKHLCEKYDMDFESTKAWYNGYLIDGMHMYNPNSVVQAMTFHDFDSYWKNSSSFEVINTFITMNYDGLKEDILAMLSGDMILVNTETFSNDLSEVSSKDEALTALIHLGYLAYDYDEGCAYLPNYEVAKGFADMVFIPRANAGNRPAMIIELKYDQTADTAIEQIKERRYFGSLSGYSHQILCVGINYDKETKKHTCVIESV